MDLTALVVQKMSPARASEVLEAGAAATAPGDLGPVSVEVCVELGRPGVSVGMVLSERCVVRKVAAGSPASAAGVVVGMRVTHVNGRRVRTPSEAKQAGAGCVQLQLAGTVDSSGRLRGRVVSWSEGRGFGWIAPDAPIFAPAGVLGGGTGGALYVGKLFCHATQAGGGGLHPNAEVEFRAGCHEGRLRACAVRQSAAAPSGVRVVTAGLARTVESVEWWNVNNLRECSKVVFTGSRTRKTMSYTKNGEARPPVKELVFDGESAIHMPEIGKTVRVPWGTDRERLLAALRSLASHTCVKHNLPRRESGGGDAAERDERGGRGDGAMVATATSRLWVGWLNPTLGERPTQLRREVEGLLQGHKVVSVRACPSKATGRLAAVVQLARAATQMQVAELNMRERAGGVRVTVDDAMAERAAPQRVCRDDADAPAEAVELDVELRKGCGERGGGVCGLGFTLEGGTARIAAVEPGSVASVAGLFRTARVAGVDGVAVATAAEVGAAVRAGVARGPAVRVTAVVDGHTSGAVLEGRVESWTVADGRSSGVIVPDVPVFASASASAGSTTGTPSVYIGDVACAASALPAGTASLAAGQAVRFRARRQGTAAGGRMRAVEVLAPAEGQAPLAEAREEDTRRGARAGADMGRVANHAKSICMMHLGGKCGKGAGCGKGAHVALPQQVPPPAPAPAPEGESSSDEAALARVLTRVGPAKLKLLQQQVSEAAQYGQIRVKAAWQLRNDALEFRFRATEYNMTQAEGRAPDMIEGFHGTAEGSVLSIAQHGFDPLRRSGQVYGAGEYFAKDPNVSVGYCRGGAYMFVCGLILGKPDVDHTWVQGCGYYVMKQRAGNIQCLPRYLIQFQDVSAGSPLPKALARFGVEDDDAEATLRKMGEDQRGGVAACKGRVDATVMSAQTRCLWVGWLDPALGHDDAAVHGSVCRFLRGHRVVLVKPERNGARVGAFVELAEAIGQAQLAELNTRPYAYVSGGVTHSRCISVDDAQPGNACLRQRRCPKLNGPGRYCRGWNLRGHYDWTETCSFRHDEDAFVTFGAELRFETLPRGTAKCDQLADEVERAGLGRVTRVRRVVNTQQEKAYESRRAFLQAKHGAATEKELWHGTSCSVLETLLRSGLQCPSDTRASDACPRSGGKGLATTLCGSDCEYCTEEHTWGMCHMFGLGIYLADSAAKSHRYVRPHAGKHSLVRCRVNLGSPYLIEGNLVERDGLHNVVRCVDPSGKVDAAPHEWDALRGHDTYYVKGLGAGAKAGHGVINNEYIAFHPAQVLPLYVVDYSPY